MKELKSEFMNHRQVVAERHTIATRYRRLSLGTLAFSLQPLAFLLAFSLQPLAFAQTGATVTWAGGNSFLGWAEATNWNPQIAPLNNPGTNFTVIVPDYTSLSYDLSSSGLIDALSFGVGSQLLVTNGQSIGVVGVAIIKGQIDARGAGSAFRGARQHHCPFWLSALPGQRRCAGGNRREQLFVGPIPRQCDALFCHWGRITGGSKGSCGDAGQL